MHATLAKEDDYYLLYGTLDDVSIHRYYFGLANSMHSGGGLFFDHWIPIWLNDVHVRSFG